MKLVPAWKNFCLHVSFIPGWNLIWNKTSRWVWWKHNKISHFFSIIEIRSLICKKHLTIKSKMHEIAEFNKKKYLLVSTFSTSLSLLLLLLKLILVNLYKTFNQKYYTCAWGLRPATLLKKRLWHRCFPVNFVKFLRTPFLKNTSGWLLLYYAKEKD